MKELSLLAVGVLLSAASASAADYYMIGSNVNGHYWELASEDCQFTEVETGVYKWTGEILGTGFKINDGTWENEEINFGSNGTPISINQEYEYGTGGYADNIAIAEYTSIMEPEVTLDLNKATLSVSGTPMGQASYKWYIVGLLNPEDYMEAVLLEPVSGETDVYEAREVEIHHSGNFKVANDGLTYQYGTSYDVPEINAEEMSSLLMRQPVNIGGMYYDLDGPYDIRWDFTNTTITFSISGQTSDTPETDLYIIGNDVNGKSWELSSADGKMTYVGEGVYEWSGEMLGTGFKINDGTWSNDRFNFGSNDTPLVLGQAYTVSIQGGNIAFDGMTEVREPKVTFNLNTLTVIVEGQGSGETEWFIAGTFNDWKFDHKLTEVSEGIYECKGVVFDGAAGNEFKITTTGWGTQYGSYSDEAVTTENLSRELDEVNSSEYACPITLSGTYDVTWNLPKATVSFTPAGSGFGDEEYAVLTVGVNDGMKVSGKFPHYGQTSVALDLDEYWEVKSATINGVSAGVTDIANGMDIVMSSDITLDIEVAYKGELVWVDSLAGIVSVGNSSVKVRVEDGNIVVAGLTKGDVVVLYGTNGVVAGLHVAGGDCLTITPSAGVYVLRVNTEAVKVSVR